MVRRTEGAESVEIVRATGLRKDELLPGGKIVNLGG